MFVVNRAMPFSLVLISLDTIASRPGTDTVNSATPSATGAPSGSVTSTVKVTDLGSRLVRNW